MVELHTCPTVGQAAAAAATFIAALAEMRVREQGRFSIALAGGSSPRPLYELLASPAFTPQPAWDRWTVFWGDERCVPPDHAQSNYRMARETVLDRVTVSVDRIHRMRGEDPPEIAARDYEWVLSRELGQSPPRLDLILLGVGEDGHVASLFPGTEALAEEARLVVANWVPALDAHRLTMTLPLINAAHAIVFFATGASKAGVVRRILMPDADGPVLPARLVRPASGRLHWFLDQAAAKRLEGRALAAAILRDQSQGT